jgi:transcriptional regulator of met regulon
MTDAPFSKPEISQAKLTQLIKNSNLIDTSENKDHRNDLNKRITIDTVSNEFLLDIDNTLSKIKEWVSKDILIEDGYYLLKNCFNTYDQNNKDAAKIPKWRISRRYAHLFNDGFNTASPNLIKETVQYIASHLALIISSEGFKSSDITIRIAGNPVLSKKAKGTVIIGIEVAEDLTKERERELWHFINNEIFANMVIEHKLRGFRPIHIYSKDKALSDFASEHRVLFKDGDICWQQDQINASKFYDEEYKLALSCYDDIITSTTSDMMSVFYINSKESEEYLLSIPAHNASHNFEYALNIMNSGQNKEITHLEIDEPYISRCAMITYIYFTHVMRTKEHFLLSSESLHSFRKIYTTIGSGQALYAIEKMRDANKKIRERESETKKRDKKNALKNDAKISYALYDLSTHKKPKLFALAEVTSKDKITLKNITKAYTFTKRGANNAIVCLPCSDNEEKLLRSIQVDSKSKEKGFFIYNNGYKPKGKFTVYINSSYSFQKITPFKTNLNQRDISELFFILPWHHKEDVETTDILTKNTLTEDNILSEAIFVCNLIKKESRFILDSYGIPSFRHFQFSIKDSSPTITYNSHLHEKITATIKQEKIIFSIDNEVILDINTTRTKKQSTDCFVATHLSALLSALNEAFSTKIISNNNDYKKILSMRIKQELQRYQIAHH